MKKPEDFFGKGLNDLLKEVMDFNFPEFDPPKREKKQVYPNIQTSVCLSQRCEKYHKLAKEFCNIHCQLNEKSRRLIEEHQKSKAKK